MNKFTRKMLNVNEVSEILGISVPYSYKIIDKLNKELERAGYLTLHGKVDSLYLQQRFFPDTAKIQLDDNKE